MYALILKICEYEYVTLHDKREFANVIKLKILRGGDYSGLFGWTWCNNNGSYKRETGGSKTEKGDMMSKPEGGVMWFQNEERRHGPRNVDCL